MRTVCVCMYVQDLFGIFDVTHCKMLWMGGGSSNRLQVMWMLQFKQHPKLCPRGRV